MIKSQSGFTLLEVLLAVSITALIGVGASQLLTSTASTKNATEQRAKQLKEIQRMDFWVKRDLTQIAGRKTRDVYGQHIDQLFSTGSDYLIEFTRSGLASLPSFGDEGKRTSRSNMQRVAYAVRGHGSEYCKDVPKPFDENEDTSDKQCLVRIYWPVLDLASDSEPLVQLLMEEVEDVRFFYRGQLVDFVTPSNSVRSDSWQEDWPGPYLTGSLTPDLVQLKVQITTKKLGEITRLYEVPRFAFTE
ncbi:GspJ family T2SS minor pseudopilin variant XcpW [Oceaniserpentilla sp. 4NH20-0058]|uniref:GspJ family type II secretion system protein n=1 Tax=Oceaniserpentilla sp. 4NH20-0058 TaxID=3127660 RepID=UPI0031089E1C